MKRALFVLILASVLVACGGSDKRNTLPQSLNLSNASGLALLTEAQANSANESSTFRNRSVYRSSTTVSEVNEDRSEAKDIKKLYKVNEEGIFVEVTYFNEEGEELSMSSVEPEDIIDINDNFFMANFNAMPAVISNDWVDELGVFHDDVEVQDLRVSYLVRKSDGKVYQLPAKEYLPECGAYFHVENTCGGYQIPTLSSLANQVNSFHIQGPINRYSYWNMGLFDFSSGLGKDEMVVYHQTFGNDRSDNAYRLLLTDDEKLRMVKLNVQDETPVYGQQWMLGDRSWIFDEKLVNEDREISSVEWPMIESEERDDDVYPYRGNILRKIGDNSFLAVRQPESIDYSIPEEELLTFVDRLTINGETNEIELEQKVQTIHGSQSYYMHTVPNGLGQRKFHISNFCDLLYYHDEQITVEQTLRPYVDLSKGIFGECSYLRSESEFIYFGVEQHSDQVDSKFSTIAKWNAVSKSVEILFSWSFEEVNNAIDRTLYGDLDNIQPYSLLVDIESRSFTVSNVLRYSDSSIVDLKINLETLAVTETLIQEEVDTEIIIYPLN